MNDRTTAIGSRVAIRQYPRAFSHPAHITPNRAREGYPRYPRRLETKASRSDTGYHRSGPGFVRGDSPPDGPESPIYQPGICRPPRPLHPHSSAELRALVRCISMRWPGCHKLLRLLSVQPRRCRGELEGDPRQAYAPKCLAGDYGNSCRVSVPCMYHQPFISNCEIVGPTGPLPQ